MTSIALLPFLVIFKAATSAIIWYVMREVGEVSDDLYIIAAHATRPVTSPDDLRKYGYIK
jgi:hypothetical protein